MYVVLEPALILPPPHFSSSDIPIFNSTPKPLAFPVHLLLLAGKKGSTCSTNFEQTQNFKAHVIMGVFSVCV